MDTRSVLAKVPGVSRNDLYYWESLGMIKPSKITAGKARRNEYSEADFRLIQMIHYHRLAAHLADFPLREIYRRAKDDIEKGLTLKNMLAR